jgi:hypothetical protein
VPDAPVGLNPVVNLREEVQVGPSSKLVLDRTFVSKQAGKTTLDATNIEYSRLDNVAPVNVTGIKGGQDGQTITLLGDGQTTLVHNAVVTKPAEPILTNTGVNKLLAANVAYHLVRFADVGSNNGKWYEFA